MSRLPVESSMMWSVGYDASRVVLEIEFDGGSVYEYYGVPAAVYEGLMSAKSHGHYFDEFIRDRYEYARVG
jgi:hypothetical protein